LGVASQGAGAAMKDIEIVKGENGAPTVSVSQLPTMKKKK